MSVAFSAEELRPAIFDFYILSKGVPPEFHDDGTLRSYRTDLLNRWRRTIIRDIEYCLACELRHLHDSCSTIKPAGTALPDWFGSRFGDVGKMWYEKYASVAKKGKINHSYPQTGDAEFNADVDTVYLAHKKHAGKDGGRLRSYVGAKYAEMRHGLSLIEVAVVAFDPKFVTWTSAFGGKKWQVVAETLFQLWLATDPQEVVRLIDTAFALQHNTAIVFNKNSIWKGPDQYAWLMNALDYKWIAHSSASLLGFASPVLQEMVRELGFQLTNDLPPKAAAAMQPQIGRRVEIKEGGKQFTVTVKNVVGVFFKSVVVHGKAFTITKQVGKYEKQMSKRVYAWEELLERVVKVHKYGESPVQHLVDQHFEGKGTNHFSAPMSNNPIAEQAKKDSAYLLYKGALASAYEEMCLYVAIHGYEMGSFLETGEHIRFQLKGASKPMRFFFSIANGSMVATINYSSSLKAGSLFGHTTDFAEPAPKALLAYLKKEIDQHVEKHP